MRLNLPVLMMAAGLVCGFGWSKKEKKPSERVALTENLPAGYALLFKLLSDEKNVAKVFIIKRGDHELHDLMKQISDTTGKAHRTLEKIGKSGEIDLENEQLPAIETATRASISKEKEKQILKSKGHEFEFRLLDAQSEALTYGKHLALVISAAETNGERREFFETLARDFDELGSRVFSLLSREPGQ